MIDAMEQGSKDAKKGFPYLVLALLIPLLLRCAPLPVRAPEDLLHEASDRVARKGDPEGALTLLNEALAKDPKFVSALMLRGAVHRILKIPKMAIRDFQTVRKLYPDFAPACLNLGTLYLEMGRTEEAEKYLTETIRIEPTYVEAYLRRSELYRSQNREKEADLDLETARKMGDRMAQEFFQRGAQEYAVGKLHEAVRLFSFTINLNKGHTQALIARGAIYLKWGETPKALDDLSHAVDLSPDHYEARFYRGSALLASGKPEEAIKDFDAAIRTDPAQARGYVLRGIVRANHQGDHDGAGEDFQRAIEKEPRAPQAYEALGLLYQSLELYTDAERELLRALQIESTAARLRLLAHLYQETNQNEKVEEAFQLALKLCKDPRLQNVLENERNEWVQKSGESRDEPKIDD